MIDPLLPSGAAERLAALRAPSTKRTKPASTSKILSAGISTTALFGMVAVMGWQSTHAAASAAAAPEATVPVTPAVSAVTPPTTVFVPTPVPSTVAPLAPAVAADAGDCRPGGRAGRHSRRGPGPSCSAEGRPGREVEHRHQVIGLNLS